MVSMVNISIRGGKGMVNESTGKQVYERRRDRRWSTTTLIVTRCKHGKHKYKREVNAW